MGRTRTVDERNTRDIACGDRVSFSFTAASSPKSPSLLSKNRRRLPSAARTVRGATWISRRCDGDSGVSAPSTLGFRRELGTRAEH